MDSKIRRIVTAVIILIAAPVTVLADGYGKKTVKFAAGVLTSYIAVHEGGHVLSAYLTDTRLDWEAGTYGQPIAFKEHARGDSRGALVNASGLLAQLSVNRYLLGSDTVDREDYFIQGLIWWNLVNPIVYALDYWWLHNTNDIGTDGTYRGDIAGIERYKGKGTAHAFTACVAAAALFQAWEYMTQSDKVPVPLPESHSIVGSGHSLDLQPVRSGIALMYTFKF